MFENEHSISLKSQRWFLHLSSFSDSNCLMTAGPDRGRSPDDIPVKDEDTVLCEQGRRLKAHLVLHRQAHRGECCYALYAVRFKYAKTKNFTIS